MMRSLVALSLLLVLPAQAALAAPTVLTLDQALSNAQSRQPSILAARTAVSAAQARTESARAPMLPQVSAGVGYGYADNRGGLGTTGNGVSLRASQQIFDFGQNANKARAAEAQVTGQQEAERLSREQVAYNVRSAYFSAQAAQVLTRVAQDSVSNQQRHLQQIEGFVTAGTKPPIDLAQGRKDLANAQVQLINAQNSYQTAKAQLSQAMGLDAAPDFEVASQSMAPVAGEDAPLETLVGEAIAHRPEVTQVAARLKGQELTVSASKAATMPALSANAGVGDPVLSSLGGPGVNWDLGVSLSWSLFNGGANQAQVHEAEATLEGLEDQEAQARQQVRLDVTQARLSIGAEKAAISAANESVKNAQEQLRLAEGRYQAGVGSILELDDAQLSLTNARAQLVQENLKLATARAQLVKALGRD